MRGAPQVLPVASRRGPVVQRVLSAVRELTAASVGLGSVPCAAPDLVAKAVALVERHCGGRDRTYGSGCHQPVQQRVLEYALRQHSCQRAWRDGSVKEVVEEVRHVVLHDLSLFVPPYPIWPNAGTAGARNRAW